MSEQQVGSFNNNSLLFASFSRRLLAYCIDFIFLTLFTALLFPLLNFFSPVVVIFMYAPFLESSLLKATLGKYLVGIQVVTLEGQKISFWASLLRTIIKSPLFNIFYIGFAFALFTQKRQALHDLIASTIVVYGRDDSIPIFQSYIESIKKTFFCTFTSSKNSTERIMALEKLSELRQKNVLSEEEFQKEKKKILEDVKY